MSKKPANITRRSFMSRATAGLSAITFSKEMVFTGHRSLAATPKNKKLLATTDYADNIRAGLFSRIHLDAMHKHLRALGVNRHQWIYNTIWNIYDPLPNGIDLLDQAVKSAHAHGLEFYAEIKPFEGGCFSDALPHSLPIPDPLTAIRDMRGIHPIVRPFVVQNPHMCLRRRPGTFAANGAVSTIRLVKGDDRPTRIKAEHLSIWTSNQNNGFLRYEGPISFQEIVAWRPCFPKSKNCRIIQLTELKIPDDHTYILVRCSLADAEGDFTNERGSIIELLNNDNEIIPFIVSSGQVLFSTHRENFVRDPLARILRYQQSPAVRSLFENESEGEKHYRHFFGFNERDKTTDWYTLDKTGYLAVACGKPEYMLGNLHPIYPEVRRHWLDMIQYCLDRGVDGINIRHSNHTRSPEAWEYGFNEPVLEAAEGRTDYPTIRRINGDAYTGFLREARELVKTHGKSLTIHLYSQMLMPDDRSGYLSYIPPNFEWQWETWVRDIADDLEFRGAWTLRPWNLRQVIETFAAITRAAHKPFYFQGNMKEIKYDWPLGITSAELDMVHKNPDLSGFVLYETAHFLAMDAEGQIKENPELTMLLKKHF